MESITQQPPWYMHSVARWIAFIPLFFAGHYLGIFIGQLAPRFLLPFNPLTPEYIGYMILNIIPWALAGLLATIFAMKVAPKKEPGLFALALLVSCLTILFAISMIDNYGHMNIWDFLLVAIPLACYPLTVFLSVLYQCYEW